MLVLDNKKRQWKHHSSGFFSNPAKQTTFEFEEEYGIVSADILQIDARFVSLLKWLGGNHIHIRLSGENRENGYAVYKSREIAFGGGTKLSAEDGFLQFMIERLLASNAPEEIEEDEDAEEIGDDMKLTSIQTVSYTHLICAVNIFVLVYQTCTEKYVDRTDREPKSSRPCLGSCAGNASQYSDDPLFWKRKIYGRDVYKRQV